MSAYLWRCYFENDLESYQQFLANAIFIAAPSSRGSHTGKTGDSGAIGIPSTALATSPNVPSRSKKSPGWHSSGPSSFTASSKSLTGPILTRADINWRDSNGLTLLHHIAASTDEDASKYAIPLLQVPVIDLFIQDAESGWTALHRALYFGNITVARALINRNIQDIVANSNVGASLITSDLIKVKDREGNSPFDVYNSSITNRIIHHASAVPLLSGTSEDDEADTAIGTSGDDESNGESREIAPTVNINGDEMFAFGSNKNFTLGFGDEDDRQYPERTILKRPDQLLHRFHNEHQKSISDSVDLLPSNNTSFLPALIQYRPIKVQDVQLSKLHSAVLTTDPEANLYVCGFGPGGRLGTGDEMTRFHFVSVCGGGLIGKKVIHVALGQNHTVAISNQGEVFTWGSNSVGQLGYSSPTPNFKDDEPLQLLPRQIFGSVKREVIVGAAASRVHTVLHTSCSLFTFGKNDGQLGLVDSDARSLVIQSTPRRVAASLFSSSIKAVSAIDKATACLLENHDVWIFANYGYTRMIFPLESFSNFPLKRSFSANRYNTTENYICKITSGGDTICVMSSTGDVFTVNVSQKVLADVTSTSSTTNPSKIRGALSIPQKVWSSRKDHMAVRDVAVGEDGSIIICTDSGSVWRRVKRNKVKGVSASGMTGYKPKDYKFSRIGRLTRVVAVRSSTFGAYAAIRKDCDVLRTQMEVDGKTLWRDLYSLLPFRELAPDEENSDVETPQLRFWMSKTSVRGTATIRQAVLALPNLEERLITVLRDEKDSKRSSHDLNVKTTESNVSFPVHEFILSGRSEVLRQSLSMFRQNYFFTIAEVMTIEYDKDGKASISFLGVDLLTVLNFVLYIYTDTIVDVWRHTRQSPDLAFRYRQVRSELMHIANHLEMPGLEQAVRQMVEPSKVLDKDMERAICQTEYFQTGDIEILLDGTSVRVHSALMCQRCPFFEGLFNGRADGQWLSSRREKIQEPQEIIQVDLKHVNAEIFQLVLRHLYSDSEDEIFDNVITADFDSFLDLILDVMAVANELMLDRLQQCCQRMTGRFVNIRNVCPLLNAVAPCSITGFKDAALEYICLNLEGILENHLLDELDEDLMLELDMVVRQNQLAYLPFAKSGRAEAELFETYPELPDAIKRNKRAQIDLMALQLRNHDDESRQKDFFKSESVQAEILPQSPLTQKRIGGSSRDRTSHAKSPSLTPITSTADLMFEMDEGLGVAVPALKDATEFEPDQLHKIDEDHSPLSSLDTNRKSWSKSQSKALVPNDFTESITGPPTSKDKFQTPISEITSQQGNASLDRTKPWGSAGINSTKLDMKEIMAQASSNRVSNISTGLSLQARTRESASGGLPKLSQRERKKKQQQSHLQLPPTEPSSVMVSPKIPKEGPTSPWQIASSGPRVSLRDMIGSEGSSSLLRSPSRNTSSPPLTMRQTISGKSTPRKAVDGSQPSQSPQANRSISSPVVSTSPDNQRSSPNHPARSASTTYVPPSNPSTPIRSIRHQLPPVEPSLQLSMAEILSQQQTEKDVIKEAAAKRSLQEIQEEQAFQEWWDQESRKVMQEEAQRSPPVSRTGRDGGRGKEREGERGPGSGSGRGRGGRSKGRGRGRGRGRGQGRGPSSPSEGSR